jgi:hypothetical protein
MNGNAWRGGLLPTSHGTVLMVAMVLIVAMVVTDW